MTQNDLATVEGNSDVGDATTVQSNNNQSNITSIPKHHVSFSNLTNDPDIKRDSEFLGKMQQIMTNDNTSMLFIPYLSESRVAYQKARRSVKKQIEPNLLNDVKFEVLPEDFVPEKSTQGIDLHNIVEISTESEADTVTPVDSLSDKTININIENNEKPKIDEYWEPNTSGNGAYWLNDVKFEVLPEDFVQKVKDPELVTVGKSRVNYVFEISLRPYLYYLNFFMKSLDYKDYQSKDDAFQ